MSDCTTQGVRVQVESKFHPEHTDVRRGQWFFSYSIQITNVGDRQVQLMSRHWVITDANGHVEQVRGPGVVGEQPVLEPGESYRYTSSCPLPTSLGAMEGTYQMRTAEGETFDAVIAPFALVDPDTLN